MAAHQLRLDTPEPIPSYWIRWTDPETGKMVAWTRLPDGNFRYYNIGLWETLPLGRGDFFGIDS